jgi:hypothetical protein
MSRDRTFDRPIVVRLVISLLLGTAAAGLFFLNRTSLTTAERRQIRSAPPLPGPADASEHTAETVSPAVPALLGEIDREVDSVLVHLGIEASWTHKKEIAIPNSQFVRTERRVLIPKDLATVVINEAFNRMAKRFNGRAIASENLRENHVTIHIEVDGTIVQTIVLRPTPNLRRDGRDRAPKRA